MNWTATGTGDGQALRVAIGKVIEAGDEFPFPAHAPMEPLNAAGETEGGRLSALTTEKGTIRTRP